MLNIKAFPLGKLERDKDNQTIQCPADRGLNELTGRNGGNGIRMYSSYGVVLFLKQTVNYSLQPESELLLHVKYFAAFLSLFLSSYILGPHFVDKAVCFMDQKSYKGINVVM